MRFRLDVFLGLALLCASCSKGYEKEVSSAEAQAQTEMSPAAPATEEAGAVEDQSGAAAPPPPAAPWPRPAPTPAARLLVYHAEVRIKADNLARASARLDSLVLRSGGHVSAATESRENGEWRSETTIRVPPARFQLLLSGLSGLGAVEEKKLTTDDVTAEHADVAARLRTKRVVEARYVALLAKAQRIKDVLDVEAKIGEVREEIEATESRLKTLNDEVGYSTITLRLYQPLPETVPDAPVVSLGSRVVESFYGGWQLLTDLLVGLVAVWPLALLGGLGLWLWRRRRIRVSLKAVPARAEA